MNEEFVIRSGNTTVPCLFLQPQPPLVPHFLCSKVMVPDFLIAETAMRACSISGLRMAKQDVLGSYKKPRCSIQGLEVKIQIPAELLIFSLSLRSMPSLLPGGPLHDTWLRYPDTESSASGEKTTDRALPEPAGPSMVMVLATAFAPNNQTMGCAFYYIKSRNISRTFTRIASPPIVQSHCLIDPFPKSDELGEPLQIDCRDSSLAFARLGPPWAGCLVRQHWSFIFSGNKFHIRLT